MKNIVHAVGVVSILLVATLSPWATGQTLGQGAVSSEQLDAFLADLTQRAEVLPADAVAIASERQWASSELGAVRERLAGLRAPSWQSQELETLKNQWQALSAAIKAISASDLERMNSVLEDRYLAFMAAFQRGDSLLDGGRADSVRRAVDVTFEKPLRELYDRTTGEFIPATEANAPAIIRALQGEFTERVDRAIADLQAQVRESENRRVALKAKLERAERELGAYQKKLGDELKKAQTKLSLSANLYLLILIIGGLSIGIIALVRWFPERVMLEWVESGQVIQFVTVMILLSVIMALGLAGLITENTLGTLLGGVGGYVLSQGVGRTAARTALREQRKPAIPPDGPTGG